MALLSLHEHAVADRVVAEEERQRAHLVVYLSGAHAYGFPSPDSDLDLKAIHVAPTRALLGLAPPRPTVDRAEIVDGVEVDYTSNEVGHALVGLLRGNGNFLERVLGPTALHAHPALDDLRALAPAYVSQRAHGHYRGFATRQRRELERQPTVKKLLYVLRTLSTGTWLLRTGELVPDLGALCDRLDLADARELIARKRAGERTPLDLATVEAWSARLDQRFADLDAARDASPLPEEPADPAALDEFLVDLRLAWR